MQSITKKIKDRIDVHIGRRSKHWPKIRNKYHDKFPICALCGRKKKTQVHHIIDFSTDPSLELDFNNLITLCMGRWACHLVYGHLGNFKSINSEVIEDVKNMNTKIKNRRK